jgi:hypothetical protein
VESIIRVAPLGMIVFVVTLYLASALAVERGDGRHVDDPATLLLPHGHGGRPHGVVGALEVDGDDRVPLVLRHVEDHPVAEDACHVHEDVDASPALDHLLHHGRGLLGVGHVARVRLRLPAALPDLGHHLGGRARVETLARQARSQVVDHHPRARLGERDRDAPTDASSCSRDQRVLAVEDAHV